MDGHRTRIVAVAILASSGLVTAGGWESSALGDFTTYADSPMVGVNIAGLSPMSTQWTLSNYYLSTDNAWSEDGNPVSFNSEGDPIFTNNTQYEDQYITYPEPTTASNPDTGDYPSGQWTVTWSGEGSVDINAGGSQNYYWLSGTNGATETFAVTAGTSGLDIKEGYNTYATGTQTISNVHIYAPGYAPGQTNAGQTFTSQFTQGLQPFGTVRYMDAQNTNSDTTKWTGLPNQSTEMSAETWTGQDGMPLQAMVALANQTNTNPWFCMPEEASTSYVTQFAQYVQAHLNSNLKVYIEYGNEDWSPSSPAYSYFQTQMNTSGLASWPQQWAADASADFAAWESVYGGSSSSLIRVAAIQSSTDATTTAFLAALGKGNFDAVADAPYFGPTAANIASYSSTTTAQQILNDMKADIQNEAATDWAGDKTLANLYSVPLIGYEGGQGLTCPPGASWYAAFVAAEESPQMEQIYDTWLSTYLGQVGGSEVNVYNDVSPITSDAGSSAATAYGLSEYQNQSNAPKLDGVIDYLDGTPEPASCVLILPALSLLLMRRRPKVQAT